MDINELMSNVPQPPPTDMEIARQQNIASDTPEGRISNEGTPKKQDINQLMADPVASRPIDKESLYQGKLDPKGWVSHALDIYGQFAAGAGKGAVKTLAGVGTGVANLIGDKRSARDFEQMGNDAVGWLNQNTKPADPDYKPAQWAEKTGEIAGPVGLFAGVGGGVGADVKAGSSLMSRFGAGFSQNVAPGILGGLSVGSAGDSRLQTLDNAIMGGIGGGLLGGSVNATLPYAFKGLSMVGGGIKNFIKGALGAVEESPKLQSITKSLMNLIGPEDSQVLANAQKTAAKIETNQQATMAGQVNKAYNDFYNMKLDPGKVSNIYSDEQIGPVIQSILKEKGIITKDGVLNTNYQPGSNRAIDAFQKEYTSNPNSPKTLDALGRALRDRAEDPSISPTERMLRNSDRSAFLKSADDASNGKYAAARILAGERLQGLDDFGKTYIAKISDIDPSHVKNIGRNFMDPNVDPSVVAYHRDEFTRIDPDTWRSIVRQGVQSITNIDTDVATPFIFSEKALGNPKVWNSLQTALDFPGNETSLAKLQAVRGLMQDYQRTMAEGGQSPIENLINTIASKYGGTDRAAKKAIQEFNENTLNFITNPKYNAAIDALNNQTTRMSPETKAELVTKMIANAKEDISTGKTIKPTMTTKAISRGVAGASARGIIGLQYDKQGGK